MNFDIASIEESARSTFNVTIGHKDGGLDNEGKQVLGEAVGFVVLGPGSDEYQAADRQIQLLNIKEASLRREKVDTATDAGAAVIVDGANSRRDILLYACVTGWYGFPDEFNRDNLARVFKARPVWARMVAASIEDESNFTAG